MADDVSINIGANPAGVEAGSRRARVALKGVADGGRDLDGALRRLRQSIDPTFAAMEKYNQTHRDNLALLRADLVTRKEYNQAMKVAKAALEAETQAIERNTAAGRAAIAEKRRADQEARQQAAAQKAQELADARAVAAEKRRVEREAAEEVKRLRREELAAIRAAAAEQKRIDRENAASARAAAAQERAEKKQTEAEVKRTAREKANAEKAAEREAAAAVRQAEKDKQAAIRETNRAAAQASKDRRQAERDSARAAREAADALAEQARAEKQAATAADELRSSIDPAYAAQMRYNETMRRATQLLMQNKLQTGEWSAIQRQARAQQELNIRSLGRQNAMYVQLGYQAQDVTASLASGINPLVILAQQGGQTAAALSQMGGTAGKVAAFFAGPWGAAIIGATLLLGYLWDQSDANEKKTNDLRNAEFRRTATIKELTAAIRDYIEAAKEKNNVDGENQRLERQALVETLNRAKQEKQAALDALNTAKKRLQSLQEQGGAGEAYWSRLSAAAAAVKSAEAEVARTSKLVTDSVTALGEANINTAKTRATMTEEDKRYEKVQQDIINTYRENINVTGAYAKMQKDLAAAADEHKRKVEEEAKARRENAKAIKGETAAYADPLRGRGTWSNNFGQNRGDHRHAGVDIAAPAGTPIMAAQAGKVVVAQYSNTLGYYVVLDHGGGIKTRYGHMQSQPDVQVGDMVDQNTQLGRVGNTGRSSGNHLHYEVRQGSDKYGGGGTALKPTKDGQYGIDAVQAEMSAQKTLRDLQKDALDDFVGDIEFKKELNREDLAEVLALQDQKIKAIQDFYGVDSKEAKDAQRERTRIERQSSQEILDEARRRIDQKLQMEQAADEQLRQIQEIDRGGQEDVIGFAESNGVITAQEAITQRAALLDQEYQQQLAHENRMYQLKSQAIRDQLALENLPAKLKIQLNAELETLEAEHLNKMGVLQAQYSRDVNNVSLQTANITMQKWREVGQSLSQSLTSSFQGIWTHSQTLQQGFINAADQMVYKFVDAGAKMFEDWFMKQVGMTTVQQAQDAARAGSTVASEATKTTAVATATTAQVAAKTGAATTEMAVQGATVAAKVAAEGIKTGAAVAGAAAQTGAAAAAGTTEITTNAAVAAAGAYKSTVVIPFIGPVAAPAAAALALAAVLGFGALISAQGGYGEVTHDGQMAQLHKKEMVLPAWIAEPLRKDIRARGSSGLMSSAAQAGTSVRESTSSENSVNFHYQPSHTNMGASFDELLRKDGRALRKWLKNEVRNGGLVLK